jgi:ABC-type Fe3+/spermidine/putrescine transport system ATPase subunit
VGECQATIRPEDITLSPVLPEGDTKNRLQGTVARIVNKGAVLNITVTLPPDITCMITRHDYLKTGVEAGQQIYLTFSPSAVHLFRDQDSL